MYRISFFAILKTSVVLFMIFSSCSDSNEHDIPSCDQLKDGRIISEEDRRSTCIYREVYLFEEEIYTICVCCLCFKASPPENCSGQYLCIYDTGRPNCMDDFIENAEYLYSVAPAD